MRPRTAAQQRADEQEGARQAAYYGGATSAEVFGALPAEVPPVIRQFLLLPVIVALHADHSPYTTVCFRARIDNMVQWFSQRRDAERWLMANLKEIL